MKCSSAVLQESGNYEDASPEKEQDGASKKGAHELSLSKKTRVMECTWRLCRSKSGQWER